MSYFFRQLFHLRKDEGWDESKVRRGKTTPESTPGSFAPGGGRAVADKGTPGPTHQKGSVHFHAALSEGLEKVKGWCKRMAGQSNGHQHQPGIGKRDKDALLKQGAEAKPLFDTWARGVVSVFGTHAVFDKMDGDKSPIQQAIEFGKANPEEGYALVLAPLKKDPRLTEKAEKEYGGDFSRITDVVRGCIMVPDATRIDDVLDVLEGAGLQLAKPPKDRINNPGEVGYRDVMLNVIMPNGHIAELQVITKHMLEAKEILGHKLYEIERKITDQCQLEQRDPTPSEWTVLKNVRQRQLTEVYEPAWMRDTTYAGAAA